MLMARLLRLIAMLVGICLATAGPVSAASRFADWSAVVVAGDSQGAEGGPTEAFDNARRDVSEALLRVGFERRNLLQFSVNPGRYRDARPAKSELEGIYGAMADLSEQATGGCLVYFTSHGVPEGVIVGEEILPPGILGAMLDETCGARPTVVVISACFSGVFVKPLAKPNRMVLTAARSDRTSFGCGEADKYPYFDDCVLRSMPTVRDFAGLGPAVRACVAAREKAERVRPPSEPQLWIGAKLKPLLALSPFPEDPLRRN
jgi:hypothetical protein